jgi:hypothetical protein
METLTIIWEKAFVLSQRIPTKLVGAVGVYMLQVNAKTYYVGKAEKQGGFKRAKDHLKGQMDSDGRCVFEKSGAKSKNDINIWAGWIEQGEKNLLIDDAEKLLTWFFSPICNKTNRRKYNGRPLQLINEGDLPPNLPPEIQSPSKGT